MGIPEKAYETLFKPMFELIKRNPIFLFICVAFFCYETYVKQKTENENETKKED